MTFTVSDALKTAVLREAQVRAGESGLTHTIASVNVMEVPDILAWVRPHELLLTTLYPLRDVPGPLDSFVSELARRELAGIVVKTGRYVDAIPEEMCAAAAREGLPLIELRSEVSFDEIITELLSNILRMQTRRLQHSEEVHRRFTSIVLDGGGLPHIVENLAQLVGNPTAIVAPDRHVLALAATSEMAQQAFSTTLRAEKEQRYLELDTTAGQACGESTVLKLRKGLKLEQRCVPCFACPIRVGTHSYGWIVIPTLERALEDDDLVAIEHAATVSALALMKEQAILAVERKFQSDFLDDLLAGRISAPEVIASRSQRLGWNLTRPCVVYIVQECSSDEQEHAPWSTTYVPDEVNILLERVRSAARHLDPAAIVVEKSGQIICILAVEAIERSTAALRRADQHDIEVGQQLLRDLRFPQRERDFIIGIGRRCENALSLHRSYQEACQAVAVGSHLRDAGPVMHFNALGFQRILSQFENQRELHAFADEQLGALEIYDQTHHTDLLHTLEVLFNCNLNMVAAARNLHLHYNSLRYRLQKIEELTGPFMDDAHLRVNLELALHIHKMHRK
jgi:purine catabolism regulator